MATTNTVTGQTMVSKPSARMLKAYPYTYTKRKRLLDIVGSFTLLVLISPLFLLIALLVKLTSRGPVFYTSRRVGLLGKEFAFHKFRSMRTDADKELEKIQSQNEKDGPIFKIERDPRVTPLGRFLRHTSLDELPQLYNVLRGNMSLVGPRPPLPHEVEKYDEYALDRLRVRPGMTCYWQISGRSNLSFDEWMRLDHKYLEDMNFWIDLKILFLTPIAVIKGEGAY